MNFLAPLFLFGALAVAAPIVFHLIRRTTREVTPFSSLIFLQPTPPRVTKRSRLENLWLLLLRCAILALLALGFARPFVQREIASLQSSENAAKRTVLLVDTSASMRREDLWQQARAKVEALVREAAPADEFALLTFDRAPRTLLSFEQWRQIGPGERAAASAQRLDSVAPTWAGTNLGAALLQAGELLDTPGDAANARREIVVITDGQEGSRLDGLQGHQWPRGLTARLDLVKAQQLENASARWIAESEDPEAAPRLSVRNAAEAKREQFALQWNGAAPTGKLDAYIPAGQTRVVRPSAPPAGADRLLLSGDAVEFDNTLFLLPRQPQQIPLLYIGDDASDDSAGAYYYLARAFQKTPSLRVEIRAVRGHSAPPAFQLQDAQMIVLGEGVEEAALAGVRQFARDGKTVLIPMNSEATAPVIARLLEAPAFTATEATVKDYAMFAQIDLKHPLFAAFADPRFSDFTKIHFWKHRRFDVANLPAARVLAEFDDRSAAIVEVPLGAGRVVILASSWRPVDSQLALSSKFVPLLYALLEQSSKLPPRKAQYFVGEEVPLPPAPQPLTIRKPDAAEVSAPAGSTFTATDQPGIYQVTPGTLRFVVNLSPEESNLTPLAGEKLTSLGLPLALPNQPAPSPRDEAQAQATELEGRQKLWRWLIVVALAVLLLETLLAGKLTRTVQPVVSP